MKNTSASRSLYSPAALGLSLLLAMAGLTGCVSSTTSTPAGTVVFAYRTLDASMAEDYNHVVDATRLALKDLEFSKVKENKDAFTAIFESNTALDKTVEITVSNTGKNLTNIKIRVGIVGDQPVSLAVLDKIKARL